MVQEYDTLLNTYKRMFGMVDVFHFNSQNTADVYGRYIDIPRESNVISITHGEIKDHRRIREYSSGTLRLGFIGSEAPYKGLPMLKEVFSQINQEGLGDKVVLYVYGGRIGQDELLSNVIYRGRFESSMMEHVYDEMDLLVVPSICYETFSFATLEALSYGTPVLVSSNVGAKDIVSKYTPKFVFASQKDLYIIIKILINDRSLLADYNRLLNKGEWNYSIENHSKMLINKIYKSNK